MKKLLGLLILLCSQLFANGQTAVHIHGINIVGEDSASVVIYKHNIDGFDKRLERLEKCKIINNQFDLVIDSIAPLTTVVLQFSWPIPTLRSILINPGDDIIIDFVNGQHHITGRNANFFSVQQKLEEVAIQNKLPHPKINQFKDFISALEKLKDIKLRALDSLSAGLSIQQYEILKEVIDNEPKYQAAYTFQFYAGDSSKFSAVKNVYDSLLSKKMSKIDTGTFVSMDGIDFIKNQYLLESCLDKGIRFTPEGFLGYVFKNFKGDLRDRLLVKWLIHHPDLSPSVTNKIKNILPEVKSNDLRSILLEYVDSVAEGIVAYDFSLTDVNGKQVNLSDFKGKPVVLDFWFTGCPGCRSLAPIMKRVENTFKEQNVVFICISVDKNKDVWKKSISTGNYVSPEIINLIADDITPLKYKVAEYPTLFLINKEGRLVNINEDETKEDGTVLIQRINAVL